MPRRSRAAGSPRRRPGLLSKPAAGCLARGARVATVAQVVFGHLLACSRTSAWASGPQGWPAAVAALRHLGRDRLDDGAWWTRRRSTTPPVATRFSTPRRAGFQRLDDPSRTTGDGNTDRHVLDCPRGAEPGAPRSPSSAQPAVVADGPDDGHDIQVPAARGAGHVSLRGAASAGGRPTRLLARRAR
jgi:hypothetical protein